MKSILAILFLTGVSASAFADSQKVDRCSWGYKTSKEHLTAESKDNYSPKSLSARDMCKIAFDQSHDHEDSGWIKSALQNLKIPKDEIQSPFFLTAEGNCIIGSKLYQKAYLKNRDAFQIELVAKSICKKLPQSLR